MALEVKGLLLSLELQKKLAVEMTNFTLSVLNKIILYEA